MYGILGVPGLTKDDVNTDITAQVEEATKELEGKLTDGSVTKVGTATVGGTTQPIYLSSGVPTKLSGTVGSATQPVYLSSGTITASGSTVGDTATPVYLNGGTVTKISANVGDTETPVYLKSGAVTKLSSTVGSGTKPMYLSSGTLTASSSTVGDATTPVYLNSGTLTKCTDLATALANVTPSKYVVSNGQGYFGTTTDGTEQELITCNSNNNVVIAYENENNTNIYGNGIYLNSDDGITLNSDDGIALNSDDGITLNSGSHNVFLGNYSEGYTKVGYNGGMATYIEADNGSETTGETLAFAITNGGTPTLEQLKSWNTYLFGTITGDSTARLISNVIKNTTSSNAANVYVDTSDGTLYRSTSSSKRYKHNINDVDVNKVKGLYDLPIVTFKYNNDYLPESDEHYDKELVGIIVEDLENVLPEAVQHNADGEPEMWNNNILVPSMLKLIQDLNERVEEQSKQIEKLEAEISEIKGAM